MGAASVFFLGLCLVIAAFIIMSVKIYQIKPETIKKIVRYGFIALFFIILSFTAIIIGLRINDRHASNYSSSLRSVESIWGGSIVQNSPVFYYDSEVLEEVENAKTGIIEKIKRTKRHELGFEEQKLWIDIKSNIRKKGFLYFPGYELSFKADYVIKNNQDISQRFTLDFALPGNAGNITDISVMSEDKPYTKDTNLADGIDWVAELKPNEKKKFTVQYKAHGTKSFVYGLEKRHIEIKKLEASFTTNFTDVNFPENSMIPDTNTGDNALTKMEWKNSNLITGQNIALNFEIEKNYGKYASKLFFYSPLAIFLFLVLILVFTVAKGIPLHPVQYLFLLIGFFIFYLFSSYLFSYMNIFLAIVVSLALSTGLMIYYAFLLKKGAFFIKLVGLGAIIFQWIFSISFFFPEHTGLIITITAVLAFIFLIKTTASIEWDNKW